MKNFEKYKDELVKYGDDFAIKDNQACKCSDIGCDECRFNVSDSCERWHWLFEKYEDETK